MESGSILIVGVGGIGCSWSSRAHARCQQLSELLLVDADETSFSSEFEAHCLHLDASGSAKGTAALPNLAAHRLNEGVANIQEMLTNSELVIILTALGGELVQVRLQNLLLDPQRQEALSLVSLECPSLNNLCDLLLQKRLFLQ